MSSPLTLFFQLIIGHALADFVLQTPAMAAGKNRNLLPETPVTWPYWLTAHALIHAGMVGIITGSWTLAAAEFAIHWAIDFAKCENWTGIHSDQAMHVACKVLWVVL